MARYWDLWNSATDKYKRIKPFLTNLNCLILYVEKKKCKVIEYINLIPTCEFSLNFLPRKKHVMYACIQGRNRKCMHGHVTG